VKFAVIVFPGSNCDSDMYHAVADELGEGAELVWHEEDSLDGFDAVLLPGGFSYGDYLRCGAIACASPVIPAIRKAAGDGRPVLGVCNGFQILTEARLLPGALLRNRGMRFVCKGARLRVENSSTAFTGLYEKGEIVEIPVAHGEGNYHCGEAELAELRGNGQIAFSYIDNPNGSMGDVAGVTNRRGNVLGMMPHPERAVDRLLGSDDGLRLFRSMLESWRAAACR